MSNDEQCIFLTKIMNLILVTDPYFCKSDGFNELSSSDFFLGDKEPFLVPKYTLVKEDYYIFCLEFVCSYSLYIGELFNKEFFNKEHLSQAAVSALHTISKITDLHSQDIWETIHHNILENLYPDSWFRADKKIWLVGVLDNATAQLLGNYFKAVAL